MGNRKSRLIIRRKEYGHGFKAVSSVDAVFIPMVRCPRCGEWHPS